MSMDGLSLYASMLEMRSALLGGRIDKIQQTEKEELLIAVRSGGENYRLLINSSAADNRVQLTDLKKQAPSEAPMFCMLLRKRIASGRILSIEQPNLDRIMCISIEAYDELGDLSTTKLYCELMGKYSNIVLVSSNGVIIDSIKRVGAGMSSVRPVLPGLEYSPPPSQEKLDPLLATEGDIAKALMAETTLGKALSNAFFGISPQLAGLLVSRYTDKKECAALEDAERQAIAASLRRFFEEFGQKAEPCIDKDEGGGPLAVYPFMPGGGMDCVPAASIGEALDELYSEREKFDWVKRHGASIHKILQNNIERCERKLAIYADSLNSTADMERSRLYGELLTANLHSLKAGMAAAEVVDYYKDPPENIAIPLDKLLTPGENAQRYYKKYQKQKAARDMALLQRENALAELDYLEGQLDNLGKCTAEAELSELIEELREQGYMKRERGANGRGKKKQKLPPSKPMRFVSSDGIEIFVGKNNVQNDNLTLRTAALSDVWMHTKNIPGSHVIVKAGMDMPDTTLLEAAALAAFYSKARGSENVPVDYTPRKFVKKPSGAKPGMVIYSTNRTIYATPSEAIVRRLEPKA